MLPLTVVVAAALTPSDHGLRARGERDAGDSAAMREPEPDTHHAAHRNPVGFEVAGRVRAQTRRTYLLLLLPSGVIGRTAFGLRNGDGTVSGGGRSCTPGYYAYPPLGTMTALSARKRPKIYS